ncbi:MAG TPA: cytochrome c oxidase assembly factor Coa1 family protein [Verrucomicrobium sp.]|nr:cytochrome c oxidase assembly factor Coa1 family protein [Verrucomicrobium sp.]
MTASPPPAYPGNAAPKSSGKKWVLFGCGGCLGLIVLGVIGVVAFVFVVLGAIKKTDAYAIALKKTTDSPQVQEALGTPITESFFSPMGAVNINNGVSTADLALTLQGPKGTAATVAKATKHEGAEWQFSVLTVTVINGPTIDLLSENLPAAAPDTTTPEPAPAPAPSVSQ